MSYQQLPPSTGKPTNFNAQFINNSTFSLYFLPIPPHYTVPITCTIHHHTQTNDSLFPPEAAPVYHTSPFLPHLHTCPKLDLTLVHIYYSPLHIYKTCFPIIDYCMPLLLILLHLPPGFFLIALITAYKAFKLLYILWCHLSSIG